ncbi:major sperm protein (MSP) domain, Vesicle-associated membrane-protein-associated protein [Artemisia annua]|uniref:Major sperm protein (MSP) domain, Vesicle-associated membrane-protein-associated protein n=1 Tax=Artemisia annua TaxID=35608 RepID=A0A2U1PHY0_ARTAN|nr:major sperm protein (MSP) domain, Vesicle-associated membrane-protein-associated protein [Artemisia annua]
MGGKLLEIDGTSIKFICEVRKQSTSSVHLSNISDDYVAFKVKTTSPKRFCVRPNSGIISPKSAYDFTVTMQGLRSAPSEVECKDKFLIQSTVVDSGLKEEDVTLELFSKSSGKYVEEKKLRVVLVSKQDSPTAEHKRKELGKEPSNETSVKQENVVKKDENVVPMENKVEDPVEVKAALTTEEPKPSGGSDGNERDLSKNLKFNPVKVVKEDPERKLRLSKQLKDLKVKETTLENQLKEVSLSPYLVVNDGHLSHLINSMIMYKTTCQFRMF